MQLWLAYESALLLGHRRSRRSSHHLLRGSHPRVRQLALPRLMLQILVVQFVGVDVRLRPSARQVPVAADGVTLESQTSESVPKTGWERRCVCVCVWAHRPRVAAELASWCSPEER